MFLRAALLLCILSPAVCAGWELKTGETIDGVPARFDFEDKTITFFNRLSESQREVASDELVLRSRQRLLLSPVFHRSYPDEGNWVDEKRKLLSFAFLTPAISLFVGFWLAGWFVTGKFNPVLAVFGFLGSWLIGCLLVFCYLMFAEMSDSKNAVIVGGATVSTIIVSIFVSAVYSCSFLKGMAVFLLQTLAAICVTALGMLAFSLAVPDITEETIWTEHVFIPVGLQSKIDSSQF